MRIKDLFEGSSQKFKEFVDPKEGLLFDLAEDLIYFMNHDDDTYRTHVYPTLVKCLTNMKNSKEVNPAMFKETAISSYKNYCQQFPIKELPQDLDDKILKEVCDKFYEEICKHKEEGKYKE